MTRAKADPTAWHNKPAGGKRKICSVCGYPARYTGSHRVAPEDQGTLYQKRRRAGNGWVVMGVGAPRVIRRDRKNKGPTAAVCRGIAQAAALLAEGKETPEIGRVLGKAVRTIYSWQRSYPGVWQASVDVAMAAAAKIIEAQAGTAAMLDDPAAFLAKAKAAERWARKSGQPFLPAAGETLRTFYASYFKPVCQDGNSNRTSERYEGVLRTWLLLTGDPPLRDISAATLSVFRDCLQKLIGRNRVNRFSPATVRLHLTHIQAILDKAGPSGPRNRDAASILERVPWVRAPRVDHAEPRTVPLALIDQLYAGLVAAEVPRFDGVRAPAWWRALLAVTYNTGLRAGTLFRLRMSDVDFGAHRLQVRAGANKSRKTFYVPLNATALAHLVTIRTDRELVFPWPFTRDWFYETFHRLQAAAAIPSDQHFGLHALRRTLATALYATSPAAAQLALGHSSVKTTEAFYVGQAAVVAPALDALPQPSAFAAAASALEAQTGAA